MEGMSKHVTSSEEANLGEDRLSILPANIQYQILSNLPTHEAFRTSLTSRMWRAMWPSLPVLIFDYSLFPDVDDKSNCFTDFIQRTVSRHDESSLKAFLLFFLPEIYCGMLIQSEWVTFAVERNAEEIVLWGDMETGQKIPDSLFTCRSVVTLGLSVSNVDLEWPMAAALPSLKHLVLIDMCLSQNCTMDLSSICPQLEILLILACDLSALTVFSITSSSLKHLSLCKCPGIEGCEVKLITPRLEKLYYEGGIAQDYDIKHLDSLSTAEIKIIETDPAQTRDDCYLSAIKFARGVRRAKSLLFNDLFIKFIKDEHPSRLLGGILFDKLELVRLCMWPTREQLLTTLFLSRSPVLTILIISITKPCEPIQNMLNGDKVEFPCMLNRLKSVEIIDFGGSESEMELVRTVLQNGPSLTNLNIQMAQETNDSGPDILQLTANQRKDMILQMLKLARSSSITMSFS